mmetsp:Transcript_94187/g.263733  ORF Transcript_94187/g.263733 Transcript_94187/m.263733 type:complete len:209 (-) Transcript_94187:539-1165(-)
MRISGAKPTMVFNGEKVRPANCFRLPWPLEADSDGRRMPSNAHSRTNCDTASTLTLSESEICRSLAAICKPCDFPVFCACDLKSWRQTETLSSKQVIMLTQDRVDVEPTPRGTTSRTSSRNARHLHSSWSMSSKISSTPRWKTNLESARVKLRLEFWWSFRSWKMSLMSLCVRDSDASWYCMTINSSEMAYSCRNEVHKGGRPSNAPI